MLSVKKYVHYGMCHFAECHYAEFRDDECRYSEHNSTPNPSVIMLSILYAERFKICPLCWVSLC